MTLKKLLKKKDVDFSEIKKLSSEYNECGGYITGYDKDEKEIDVYFSKDSDEIYELIEELAKHLNIVIK